MQHLVIQHVPQKPQRHKRLIQRGINPNDAVLFLYRAKNELLSRTVLPPASPDHLVAANTPAKVLLVQIIKDFSQIEMRPLVAQIQLPLHRQLWVCEFTLGYFLSSTHCHILRSKRYNVV